MSRNNGISPVIATLLLIAIAVAAAIIVYAFVTGLIGGLTTINGEVWITYHINGNQTTTTMINDYTTFIGPTICTTTSTSGSVTWIHTYTSVTQTLTSSGYGQATSCGVG